MSVREQVRKSQIGKESGSPVCPVLHWSMEDNESRMEWAGERGLGCNLTLKASGTWSLLYCIGFELSAERWVLSWEVNQPGIHLRGLPWMLEKWTEEARFRICRLARERSDHSSVHGSWSWDEALDLTITTCLCTTEKGFEQRHPVWVIKGKSQCLQMNYWSGDSKATKTR